MEGQHSSHERYNSKNEGKSCKKKNSCILLSDSMKRWEDIYIG